MRLIDADKFKEEMGTETKLRRMISSAIDKQPTAYDIEKIVGELETLRIDKCNYFGMLNVVVEKYDRANEMLDDAIDIVRKGGVEWQRKNLF